MRIVYNGCVFARVSSLLLGEAVLSQRAVFFFFINLKICVAIVN